MATKSAPITSESGLSQLVTGSPAALPTGTRPPAIAPTTVPMKKGVSTDASPKTVAASARPLGATRGVVEREAGAPQHDPERGEAQRDEQGREDRLERGREARPEHDEHEDQPDVVGLPDRPDRPVDQLARPPAALAPAGEQAPEAGPEVRAAEDGVHGRADPEDDRDGVGATHCGPSARAATGRLRLRAVRHLDVVLVGVAPASRHRPQRDDQRRTERDVERDDQRRR